MPRDLLLELSAHGASDPPMHVLLAAADTPSVPAQSFDALRATALQLLADDDDDVSSCSLKYLDSDGDLVTLASDRDLLALLQYMNDEQLARVTVVVKATRGVVQRQLRGLVAAVTKFAQQLERKDEQPTVADALKWLEKSVAAWEVAADSAPELATIRDELLQVLSDAEFRCAVEETSKANEFKGLVEAVLDAIFKKDELVAEDLLSTRLDEMFAFAQRVLAACPSLKQVLVRLAKRCAACLVRYNGELLAQRAENSETVETLSVDADASAAEAEAEESGPQVSVCFACLASPIVGTIYQSEENPHMQLCDPCFSTGEHHDDSDDFAVLNDAQRVLHPGVMCDGCEMLPIAGVRYKALNDKDFDLCEACEASGKWASHEPFVKITDPSRAPKKLREQEASTLVHPFVTCDGCEMSPIVGKRFKSTVVHDFDLCEACEASGVWQATHTPFATIEAGDFRGKKAWFKFGEGKFKKHCGPRGRHGHHGHHGHHKNHEHPPPHPHPHPHPPHYHHHHGPRHGPALNLSEGWRENMQLHARFVEDMTIPDGCVVSPSASLRKSWKLENSGETAWPLGCRLEIQAGNPTFGIQVESTQVGLPALQPGEYAVADVDVRAPAAPGRYTTYWRVCDPSGTHFGHRFWIDIVVAGSDEEIISASGIDAGVATASGKQVDLTEANDSDSSSDSASDSSSDSDSDSASSDDNASEKSVDDVDDSVADDDDDDEVEIVGVRTVETEETDQYRDALAMLASMGFTDAAKNRRHLETADGNVTDAVVSLLSE